MDIRELSAKFLTSDKVAEFIGNFRKMHGLEEYNYELGSPDHIEIRQADFGFRR